MVRTLREKLVARYLYEHLFLAHLHFTSELTSEPPTFFRLVRSRSRCEAGIDEIATRRPNDDPGPGEFSYCLTRVEGTIVDKTHIPYDLSLQKLERIRANVLRAAVGREKPAGLQRGKVQQPVCRVR